MYYKQLNNNKIIYKNIVNIHNLIIIIIDTTRIHAQHYLYI